MGKTDGRAGVRVDVLGPLQLVVDGVPVDVRGPKRRAVLALLALAEGRALPVDTLLDALWPTELPDSGRQALHSHVSRLRAQLGPAADRLTTLQDGYRLDLHPEELDLARARALLRTARAEAAADPAAAYARLGEAHGLWRGPVLADLMDVGPIAAAVEECAQLHREVTDALVDAAIAAGRADAVVGLAAAALAVDPLREPAVLLHMRALAAAGRAPEALRAGREYRRRLADETGLDPSPSLDETERAVAGGAAGPPPARVEQVARPTTRLFGREVEVAALHRLLAAERLVTVVGPGGVGKTRVALEVAQHSGSAMVLPLAPVTEPAAISHALAATLNLTVTGGDVLAACLAVLGDRPGLLVVDNCEHLLDAVRDTVGTLLVACPRLSVLATSREPLGLAAEHTYRLAPLPLPVPGKDPAEAASVALFVDRARRVRPGAAPTPADLHLVTDIVRRLDGVPLAIELAAGRLSTFSLPDLHRRLDRSLDLLGGRPTGEARHRTLRATVEWSYRLLDVDEQRLFRHLSVFVDGVDLDTAEWVAVDLGLGRDPGSTLARLVDASMVEVVFERGTEAGGAGGVGKYSATRYRLLETLRAFGLDRLAADGERDAAERRLVRWAVRLVEWIGATVITERELEADAALRRELPNLRAAWRFARDHGLLDEAAGMVPPLLEAVAYRDLVELRSWAEELADDPALVGHPLAGPVLGTAACAAYHRGDFCRADELARAGLERAIDVEASWYCVHPLASAALARGVYADAIAPVVAAAERETRARQNLWLAALGAAYAGDLDQARTLNERGSADAVSPTILAWRAYTAGEIESAAGQAEPAERHYVRAIELARTSGATFLVGVAMVGLLAVRATAGRTDDALRGYRKVIDYFDRTGNWTHQWTTLRNLADLLRKLGDDESAALLDAAADAAPDAPARNGSTPADTVPALGVPGRADVLDAARRAIDRHLAPVRQRR
jgi:predicted ATPase/DNA-binding SARP family transcriptional activator